jgi:diacylglycerol O-acyltransferase
MWRMNGTDAYMLAAETPRAYMHTFKIAILDPAAEPEGWSYENYRSAFLERLSLAPVFRWKYAPSPLGLNHPMWIEDPEFNIDHHIKRVACPSPGDQKALCEFMSSVYADQLDRSRPLWKTWVVEGLEDGKVAIVNIIHHAYFDGAGASYVLQQFFNPEPGVNPAPPEREWQPEAYPSWIKRLLWALRDWPRVMLHYLPRAVCGLCKRIRVEADGRKKGHPPHPNAAMMQKTPINTALSHGRTFVCDSLPLAEIKRVSKTFGVTINDVFINCSAGALRRYLLDLDYCSNEPLIAGVPLSGRRPENMAGIGNYATADFCWLHTEIADPVERLQASHRSATEMKAHARLTEGADIGSVVALCPPWVIKFVNWRFRRSDGASGIFGNVVLSNVVGPARPLYLNHTALDNWFSTGQVFEGSSLNMTLWSYCENANLCILADEQVLPDGWVLFRYFKDELDALIKAGNQVHHGPD